ncbi:MAG: hypothetical protein HXS44_06325 [Theionarchaea archaeon]|nr:hypothetical protein [Theionarchaea archaeon]
MVITSEMEEILFYLHRKDNYALFAGFAAFLHGGVEPSMDLDIFVSSPHDVKEITEDFIKKGWTLSNSHNFFSTVEKNNTTFDIIYSESAKKAFLPCALVIPYKDLLLSVISAEALFLTKMAQVSALQRSPEKTARDRKIIYILRQRIDSKKVKELLLNMDDSLWIEGW